MEIGNFFKNLKEVKREEATLGQISVIESLLHTANLTPEQKDILYYDQKDDAKKVIQFLNKNQIDIVESGFYCSQNQIKYKLKQL